MQFNDKITEDLKKAMKEKDQVRTSCLRMLKAALKNKQVEKGRELEDEEIHATISSLVKKGKEAIIEFRAGGREDLALKEEEEVKIFYEYLPQQLGPEEIEKTLREIISELSVTGPKDLGKVMKVAMARMAGQVQGKQVNEIARKLLS
ncbi:MAG: GatB/YqeY domain-containing protein [Pseudomonadota bacterium]